MSSRTSFAFGLAVGALGALVAGHVVWSGSGSRPCPECEEGSAECPPPPSCDAATVECPAPPACDGAVVERPPESAPPPQAASVPDVVPFFKTREFLVVMSGFPVGTESAVPTLRLFFDELAKRLGWSTTTIQGDYYPDIGVGLQQIRDRRPDFAAMSLDLYLAYGSELQAKVVARPVMHGRDRERYHIVVAKEGGPASADALAGKVLVPFRESARFLGNLVLDGRALAETLDLQYEHNLVYALHEVARGRAVAAVVDEEIIERFDELPALDADAVTVLLTGPWIPGSPIVGLTESTDADRAAMRTALVGLCSGDGDRACRACHVDSFEAATDQDYDEVRRLWAR